MKGVSESLAGRVGFVEQILNRFNTRDAYFWATHSGAGLDLMVAINGRRHGFEIRFSDAPKRRRSMHTAVSDLGLEHLWVVYPGTTPYSLSEHISVVPPGAVVTGDGLGL